MHGSALELEPEHLERSSTGHRFVFIGGLHRSGTTPLASWLGAHPEVSSLHDTGVHADEGQHLQDVYPPASRHGGPGRFALRRASCITEASPLASVESRQRLWSAWAPHWDLARPVLLEKSPPNMLRTRFLQALFPESWFLIVVRHPVAVAYATKKWTRSSVRSLLRHWAVAHEHCLADAEHIRRIAFVRYEDLIADLDGELKRIFKFMGISPCKTELHVKAGLNSAYLDRWEAPAWSPLQQSSRNHLERTLEDRFTPWGYSLRSPRTLAPADPTIAHRMIGSGFDAASPLGTGT